MDRFDSEEIYELMQTYRHVNQRRYINECDTVAAFEAVKAFCREAVADARSDEAMETREWIERHSY